MEEQEKIPKFPRPTMREKLPDGHPFKGNMILFGSQIPPSWKEHLRKLKADREAGQDTTEKQLPKEDVEESKDNYRKNQESNTL